MAGAFSCRDRGVAGGSECTVAPSWLPRAGARERLLFLALAMLPLNFSARALTQSLPLPAKRELFDRRLSGKEFISHS